MESLNWLPFLDIMEFTVDRIENDKYILPSLLKFLPSFLYQLSILTIIYLILGVKSGSPTFLVAMSDNHRPPSLQSILCILHFSPLITKCNLLAMCLVCLVSLPYLVIHTSDLISKTIRASSSGTIYGSLFNNS